MGEPITKPINEVMSKLIVLRVFGNPKQHDTSDSVTYMFVNPVFDSTSPMRNEVYTNSVCILPTDEEDVNLTARSQLLVGMILPDVLVPAAAAGDTNTVRMCLQHHPDQVRVLLYLKHTVVTRLLDNLSSFPDKFFTAHE